MFTPTIKLEHSDGRGEIYSIELPGNREIMLLHSVGGVFRGGHSHTVDEIVGLLSGRMRYHKRYLGVETQRIMEAGDLSYNRGGEIHMGEFLEDSWVVEAKFGEKGTWQQTNYPPYREIVEASLR
mgnify:CR=1 FL=1